jgi:hypothetical protein
MAYAIAATLYMVAGGMLAGLVLKADIRRAWHHFNGDS